MWGRFFLEITEPTIRVDSPSGLIYMLIHFSMVCEHDDTLPDRERTVIGTLTWIDPYSFQIGLIICNLFNKCYKTIN